MSTTTTATTSETPLRRNVDWVVEPIETRMTMPTTTTRRAMCERFNRTALDINIPTPIAMTRGLRNAPCRLEISQRIQITRKLASTRKLEMPARSSQRFADKMECANRRARKTYAIHLGLYRLLISTLLLTLPLHPLHNKHSMRCSRDPFSALNLP